MKRLAELFRFPFFFSVDFRKRQLNCLGNFIHHGAGDFERGRWNLEIVTILARLIHAAELGGHVDLDWLLVEEGRSIVGGVIEGGVGVVLGRQVLVLGLRA
jgi:hypothetical protein